MTDKQEAFCVAYAKSGNATQAAIEAGYSENGANGSGARLLANVSIQNRLKELAEEVREQKESEYKRNIMSAVEIQSLLTDIATGKIGEDVVVTEGCGNGYSESRLMHKPAALKDRLKALDQLAKMQGGYNLNLNIDGTIPVVLVDDVGGDDSEN